MKPIIIICRFGRRNEKPVRQRYERYMQENHPTLRVEDAGLHIHPDYFYLGASDAYVSCFCCGAGICEIKCPMSKAHCTIEEAVPDHTF